jgi:hypothetical protein
LGAGGGGLGDGTAAGDAGGEGAEAGGWGDDGYTLKSGAKAHWEKVSPMSREYLKRRIRLIEGAWNKGKKVKNREEKWDFMDINPYQRV